MIKDAYDYAAAKAKDVVIGEKPDGWIADAIEAEKQDIPLVSFIEYNNYKSTLKGKDTKQKFIEKIYNDTVLTPEQKDKLDDFWYKSDDPTKNIDYTSDETFLITQLSEAQQRQYNVAKKYGFDSEKFAEYVIYVTQQGKGKTKANNINDAVKAGLSRGEAVLLYNIMRKKAYRFN